MRHVVIALEMLKTITLTQLFGCSVEFDNIRNTSHKSHWIFPGFASLIQGHDITFDLIAQSEYYVA